MTGVQAGDDIVEYIYNAANKLTEVKYPDGTYVKYGYDAFGRKASREEAYWNKEADDAPGKSEYAPGQNKDKSNNGKGNGNDKTKNNGNSNKKEKINPLKLKTDTTTYLYDGFTNAITNEYTGNGSPLSQYNMANDRIVSKKTFGNHGQVIPGREPSLKTNGGLMYYSYDGMRNVTELTDRHGDSIEQYRYDAFGGLYTGVTAPYNTNSFAGKNYDAKANLIDMNARWYGAQNGRFTTADPYTGDILTPYTQNRYAYVGNNPINRWDPLGYWEDGDEDLTPKAQSAIRRLTDKYDATPIEDQVKRDSIHAQAESIRKRDWERWESETENYKGSREIEIENSKGETYKVTGGWNTDWTKTIEYIREYEVITSYYSEYAGKYAEERYTRHDSTTKHSEGFNFRPFTAQEWYGENKSVLEEYETPPPYIPMEAYSSITSEYSFSNSTITSGTAKLFNGDEVIGNSEYKISLNDTTTIVSFETPLYTTSTQVINTDENGLTTVQVSLDCNYLSDGTDKEGAGGGGGTGPKMPTAIQNWINSIKLKFNGIFQGGINTNIVNGFELKVNVGQQQKHMPGTNNYKNEIANGKIKSPMNGNVDDIQNLLNKKTGTGEMIGTNKERVDFGDIIGQYVDPTTRIGTDTSIGIIHYGKNGAHIVPARPK